MPERLCVIMPVFNESGIIEVVLENWYRSLEALGIDFEIWAYNDGSRDASLAVMRQTATHLGKRLQVRDKPNGGHGNTILIGYREAAQAGFDWIFQVDSDNEMDADKFAVLWSHRLDFDFLAGIREGRQQPLTRKVISAVSRGIVRVFYGKGISDVNVPYRLMRVAAFRSYFARIPLTTFAPNLILSGLATRDRLRCFETPVRQRNRQTGEVSIRKWRLFKASVKSCFQTIAFALDVHVSRTLILILLLLGLVIITGIPGVTMGIDVDSDVYLCGGKIVAGGGRMYADYFDHKGPVMFLINALAWKIYPGHFGIWLLEWLFFIIALFFLGKGLLRKFGRVASIFAMITIILMKSNPTAYQHPESYVLELTMLSVGVLLWKPGKWSSLLAGMACAISFFMKQTLITSFVGIFVYLALSSPKGERRSQITYFAVASLVISAAMVFYMAVTGVLHGYYRDCFAFNLLYQNSNERFVSGFSLVEMAKSVQLVFRNLGDATCFAIMAALACFFRCPVQHDRSFQNVWKLCWLVVGGLELLLVARCGRGYHYQLYMLRMVFLFALLPLISNVELSSRGDAVHYCRASLLTLLLVPLFYPHGLNWMRRSLSYFREKDSTDRHIAFVLREMSDLPNVPVFVWGNCTRIYLLSDHPSVCRYHYWTPLSVDGFLSDGEIDSIIAKLQNFPAIVVDEVSPNSLQDTGIFKSNTHSKDSKFKRRLREVVSSHYHVKAATISGPTIYVHNSIDL